MVEWSSPVPERVNGTYHCNLAARWLISVELAYALEKIARQWETETQRDLYILSGHRSADQQRQLERQGRPTASLECSTHTTCPATGADLWVGPLPTNAMKATFGRIVIEHGRLRWGGGSPVDPETGIPEDWNHVDTGPRCT